MQRGFTIVELLIGIVVIGVLTVITVVSYNGITNKTHEVSLQSDLNHSQTQLELDRQTDGAYPSTLDQANNGRGITASAGNTLVYALKSYGYCITASNPNITTRYTLKSSTNQIQTGGDCTVQITTTAGNDASGFADGTGSTASFNVGSSSGAANNHLAASGDGILYVSDTKNHRIRKVNTNNGEVTTLAGSDATGYVDGSGSAAQFNSPESITIGPSGVVYVVDGNRVRKITAGGVVTTLTTSVTVTGYPIGIAVDSRGNCYLSISYYQRIDRVTPDGAYQSYYAGSSSGGYADGALNEARFSSPRGMAVDSQDNIYVYEPGGRRVRKISTTGAGRVTTFITTTISGSDGMMAVGPYGDVYLAGYGNMSVMSIWADGSTHRLGRGNSYVDKIKDSEDGPSSSVYLDGISGMAVDPSDNVWIISNNNRIRKVTQ